MVLHQGCYTHMPDGSGDGDLVPDHEGRVRQNCEEDKQILQQRLHPGTTRRVTLGHFGSLWITLGHCSSACSQ
eukprot:309504-Pyramimonas_sp.AAC.1